MNQPHDNWGEYYDFVYEQTFGGYYDALTAETLNVIKQILPDATIIDFGAGTGRLAIPLAENGHKVVAVEKSAGMVNEFKRKLSSGNAEIEIHNCSISEYDGGNQSRESTLSVSYMLVHQTRETHAEIAFTMSYELIFIFSLFTILIDE